MKPWDLTWEARSFNLEEQDASPWLVCVTSSWHDLFLAREVLKTKPTSIGLWNILIQAFTCSERVEVPRPKSLRVEAHQGWESLTGRLKEIGIKLVKTCDLDYPDGFPEWIDSEWQKWQHRT